MPYKGAYIFQLVQYSFQWLAVVKFQAQYRQSISGGVQPFPDFQDGLYSMECVS